MFRYCSKNYIGALALFVIMFLSCAPVTFRPTPPLKSPIVRVGLVQRVSKVTFTADKPFFVTTKTVGEKYRLEKGEWTLRSKSQPDYEPQQIYKVRLAHCDGRTRAEKVVQKAREKGIPCVIENTGNTLRLGGRTIAGDATFYVDIDHEFRTRQKAEQTLGAMSGFKNATVISTEASPHGIITMTFLNGKTLELKDAIRCSGAQFTIFNIPVGQGYHWAHQESRTFNGEIEFYLDHHGMMTVINVLPLSDYLLGVLPGEMSSTFPLEALKAQAIAARTYFLHNFGRKHRNDPFDVCADVHCQSFVGIQSSEKNEQAVRETLGEGLVYKGELCSTPYSAMCGGHTEYAQNVWQSDGEDYLKGVYDMPNPERIESRFDLSIEKNARKWIKADADVFCNVERNGNPEFAAYAKKYFRWEKRFTSVQLEHNIKKHTGLDFGSLLNLIPGTRGVSGRLVELIVVGTKDTFTIQRELNIRKALSPSTLFSACIYIDKIDGIDGQPEEFIIKGAGWGHGVGMCQIGAAMMALHGYKANDILKHYYQGAVIDKLY